MGKNNKKRFIIGSNNKPNNQPEPQQVQEEVVVQEDPVEKVEEESQLEVIDIPETLKEDYVTEQVKELLNNEDNVENQDFNTDELALEDFIVDESQDQEDVFKPSEENTIETSASIKEEVQEEPVEVLNVVEEPREVIIPKLFMLSSETVKGYDSFEFSLEPNCKYFISGDTELSGKITVTSRDENGITIYTVKPVDENTKLSGYIIATPNVENADGESISFPFTYLPLGDIQAYCTNNNLEVNVNSNININVINSAGTFTIEDENGNTVDFVKTKREGTSDRYYTASILATEPKDKLVLYVKENDVVQEIIVKVLPSQVPIEYTLDKDETVIGDNVYLTITNTDKFRVTCEDSEVIIVKSDKVPNQYAISTIGKVDTCTIDILLLSQADNFLDTHVSIKFLERELEMPAVKFNKEPLEYTFDKSAGPIKDSIIITNFDSNARYYIKSSSFKLKAVLEGDVINITSSDVIESPVTGVIEVKSDRFANTELPFTINIPKPKEHFDFDKTTIKTLAGEEIFFSVPISCMKSVSIQPLPGTRPEDYQLQLDVNRFCFRTNRVGTYMFLVQEVHYLDSIITIVVEDKQIRSEIVNQYTEEEIKTKAEEFGLPVPPVLSKAISSNNFVNDLLECPECQDLGNFISYAYFFGPSEIKILLSVLLKYELDNRPNSVFKGPVYCGHSNKGLYYKLKNVLNLRDYHEFKAQFTVVIKVFQYYKDSAYSIYRLMRFDEAWPGTSNDLERYKCIISFIHKVVTSNNSQSLVGFVGSLRPHFSNEVIEMIRQYAGNETV